MRTDVATCANGQSNNCQPGGRPSKRVLGNKSNGVSLAIAIDQACSSSRHGSCIHNSTATSAV
jgi:hypothetical protein